MWKGLKVKASIVSEKVTLVTLVPLLEFQMVRVLGLSITASSSSPVSWDKNHRPISQSVYCKTVPLPDGARLTSVVSHCMSTSGLFPRENSAKMAACPTSQTTHWELASTEARRRE